MANTRPTVFKEDSADDSNTPINNTPQVETYDFSVPYDVIPLPSEGKAYKNKKSTLKVHYLTASDENILTSPNLIESGKFLDILISRKVADKDLPYRDLLLGDRNAIMIWLRATGYGEIYNAVVTDPDTGEDFDTEIDLTAMKSKHLTIDSDENGEFDFTLPRSGKPIKFRFLTVGDEDDMGRYIESSNKKGPSSYSNILTFRLGKHIAEIDGNRDRGFISKFIENMLAYDSLSLRTYIDDNEPGLDMNIEIERPGGGVIKTTFPFNPSFFWPNLRQ